MTLNLFLDSSLIAMDVIYLDFWSSTTSISLNWRDMYLMDGLLGGWGIGGWGIGWTVWKVSSTVLCSMAQCPDAQWWQEASLRGPWWDHCCSIFSSMTWMKGSSTPSASFQTNQTEWCSWHAKGLECHPEGPGPVWAMDPWEPPEFQQGQVQGPATGSGQHVISMQTRRWRDGEKTC